MREIGTTAGFLEIGDTFRGAAADMGTGPLVVRDLMAIDNRPNEMIYECVDTPDDGNPRSTYRIVLKAGAPIVLCIGE